MADERKELIQHRAYVIWQEEGCPHGQDQRHWLQAEQEITNLVRQENLPAIRRKKSLQIPAAA